MARVDGGLYRPDQVTSIDSRKLLPDEEVEVDSKTGLPRQLRAFVVVRDPRMTVVPHFCSEDECRHLVQLVEGSWIPSLVGQATDRSQEDYDRGNLENMLAPTRTSWSCMLRYAQTSVVESLEHRLAAVAGLPVEQLERMNMVRYAPGEHFAEHHDGKFRPRTVFVYLNDLDEKDDAGDTFFPYLGVSFRPRRGTAVVWSNVSEGREDKEDSRMLHAGRPPSMGVKYGVNCFFNVAAMRHIIPDLAEHPYEESVAVDVRSLCSGACRADAKLLAYQLCREPKLVAVPNFLSQDEIEHVLDLLGQVTIPRTDDVAPYASGTQTLHVVAPDSTLVVQAVEARIAATAGLQLDHLAPLRIVRCGSSAGLCNRGCGPKSAFMCLAETHEVFFFRLGMRLQLKRGDLLMWPNVDWSAEQPLEDLRTERVHVAAAEEGSILGLDAFFHDSAIRSQQRLRKFVPD
eukprot:TRINITY_DN42593_c0_g1_i1.p1 TRINITY_DN42593_c0_g1~~TRINITY_DN42593_c0_g1_i1.p1  ORF type:complete len:458 (-),score=65.92 TRINITY_DN42593_c0_g1_i1:15-1388(-)